uniref:Uncharacterized protein n=1 Tax=Biomphalaria glabrata TaxID=6526 RepID=A0A2C9L9W6_BIOGL
MPENSQKHFRGYINNEVSIRIKVYGHPIPKDIQLMKGKELEKLNQTKYNASLVNLDKPFIYIDVIIREIQEEDFTNYFLKVDNGIGKPLLWEFMVVKGDSISKDNTVVIASSMVGTIFCLVFVGVYVYKKRKQKVSREPSQQRTVRYQNIELQPTEVFVNQYEIRRTVPLPDDYENENQVPRTVSREPNQQQTVRHQNIELQPIVPPPEVHVTDDEQTTTGKPFPFGTGLQREFVLSHKLRGGPSRIPIRSPYLQGIVK